MNKNVIRVLSLILILSPFIYIGGTLKDLLVVFIGIFIFIFTINVNKKKKIEISEDDKKVDTKA